MREYGTLAQTYVREFDRKWLRGGAPPDEPFVGSADIQSLADLGNSFEVVKDMRYGRRSQCRPCSNWPSPRSLPVLPLMLTMISLEQLLDAVAQDGLLMAQRRPMAIERR